MTTDNRVIDVLNSLRLEDVTFLKQVSDTLDLLDMDADYEGVMVTGVLSFPERRYSTVRGTEFGSWIKSVSAMRSGIGIARIAFSSAFPIPNILSA